MEGTGSEKGKGEANLSGEEGTGEKAPDGPGEKPVYVVCATHTEKGVHARAGS